MRSIQPVVLSRIGRRQKGRGFSRGELKLVGLTAWSAQRIGLPVDLRRRSTHEENVLSLKAYLEERYDELEEKKQVSSARRAARAEAKLQKEVERARLVKEAVPVKVEEPLPIEASKAEIPELVEDEVTQIEKSLTPLSNLEGMISDEVEMLKSQEIEYAEDLLGLSSEDMDDIVTASGIRREKLEQFVFQAIDKLEQPMALNDVPSIGEKTAERLKQVGVQTANQLARMNPNIKVEGVSKARLKTLIDNAWTLILKT
ncbi:MAG: ribosomal protein L13e [Candidatus Heimdallarchaeota archaeon]